ncbi:unnamed protein product [Trichogramma brassicae]|uniref:Uncharacterized protein n=1 Tax=Trichogramma brassicae TaxID=86971 RepID=A0A6H5ITN8_9HYME|nr:unnamed protein product [Trichogramma brassicae]
MTKPTSVAQMEIDETSTDHAAVPTTSEAPQQYSPEENEFLRRCHNTCYLDGKFFSVNLKKCDIKEDHVYANCKTYFKIKHGDQPLQHLTRHLVGTNLDKLYQKQISEIKENLKNISVACTTADIWTGKTRHFLGVTVHWPAVDQQPSLRSGRKCRRALPCNHSEFGYVFVRFNSTSKPCEKHELLFARPRLGVRYQGLRNASVTCKNTLQVYCSLIDIKIKWKLRRPVGGRVAKAIAMAFFVARRFAETGPLKTRKKEIEPKLRLAPTIVLAALIESSTDETCSPHSLTMVAFTRVIIIIRTPKITSFHVHRVHALCNIINVQHICFAIITLQFNVSVGNKMYCIFTRNQKYAYSQTIQTPFSKNATVQKSIKNVFVPDVMVCRVSNASSNANYESSCCGTKSHLKRRNIFTYFSSNGYVREQESRAANSAGDGCQCESCGRTTISLDMAIREPTHANGPAASASALSALFLAVPLSLGIAEASPDSTMLICLGSARLDPDPGEQSAAAPTTKEAVQRDVLSNEPLLAVHCSLLYRWSSCLLAQRSTLLLLFFFLFHCSSL